MSARHLRNMRVKLDPADHGYGDGKAEELAERRRRYDAYLRGWQMGASGMGTRSGLASDPDERIASAFTVGHRIGKAALAKARSSASTLFGCPTPPGDDEIPD